MAAILLVVDDEPDLLHVLTMILTHYGYDVRTAANGQQALAEVARQMPDLILLDMKMPVMSGWEFAKAFRRAHDHLAPIVVITAAEDARQRAEEIHAEGWVGKPFDFDHLLMTIRQNLARKAA